MAFKEIPKKKSKKKADSKISAEPNDKTQVKSDELNKEELMIIDLTKYADLFSGNKESRKVAEEQFKDNYKQIMQLVFEFFES